MVVKIAIALVVVGLMGLAFSAPRTSADPKARGTRIVFVGDSNTRGTPHTSHGEPAFPGDPNPIAAPFADGPYGGGPGGKSAYVNLLRQRLGKGFELFNRGRGGTRALVWANDEQGILTEVKGLNPDVVVLYVGLSGIVLKEKQSDFEKAMPMLLKEVRSWPNVKWVFVVNVPPIVSEELAPVIQSYNKWLSATFESSKDVTLIDVHAILSDEKGTIKRRFVDHPDLYHQNYNGHYEVSQIFLDAFLDAGVLAPKGSDKD